MRLSHNLYPYLPHQFKIIMTTRNLLYKYYNCIA